MVQAKHSGIKGVNFVLEAVLVWLGERNISVLVDTDVPFRENCYLYISIHKYMFVFINYEFINFYVYVYQY